MLYSRLSGLALAAAFLTSPMTQTRNLCKGFLPENNLKISVKHQVGGLSKSDFDAVLDRVYSYYSPFIQAKGATFEIDRQWDDDTVNAYAQEYGSTWIINMFGGLARHPVMTKDGFFLVACHETGHHLGGAPKSGGGWGGSDWASVEGEADYYGTLHCLRNVWPDDENAQWYQDNQAKIDPTLMAECNQQFNTAADRNFCMRDGMAGLIAGLLFQDLSGEKTVPAFNTPDPNKVRYTDEDHPATQCRLDTYYAGSICTVDRSSEPVNDDANVASCSDANGTHDGSRPRCWFAP